MKYLSLFTGIGGFELGIQKAYEHISEIERAQQRGVSRHSPNTKLTRLAEQQPTCIGYSEIDKYATQIYQKQFPKHINYGDITKINAEQLPDFDFLCGGFPCQSFSIAGKRRGFEDTRGTLFFDIARILQVKKPRLLLLENVKGLLSHDNGKTFATIVATLSELGYDLQWQVLNSKNFGVPQNRERVFIVGHLRGTRRPEVFPIGENSEPDFVLPTLTARYYGGQANGGYIRNKPKQIIGGSQGNRVYDPSGTSVTLASQAGGLGAKTGLYATPKIRRLTPLECERLQGFPDNWTKFGLDRGTKWAKKLGIPERILISDTQRYKMCGNAVTVNVIQIIMEQIYGEKNSQGAGSM